MLLLLVDPVDIVSLNLCMFELQHRKRKDFWPNGTMVWIMEFGEGHSHHNGTPSVGY